MPIQLYLVVAFVFFIGVSKIGVRDYIPSVGDHNYYFLSDYRLLKWAMPFDKWIENDIDNMWVKKGIVIQKELEKSNAINFIHNNQLVLTSRGNIDSVVLAANKFSVISFRQMVELISQMFKSLFKRNIYFI